MDDGRDTVILVLWGFGFFLLTLVVTGILSVILSPPAPLPPPQDNGLDLGGPDIAPPSIAQAPPDGGTPEPSVFLRPGANVAPMMILTGRVEIAQDGDRPVLNLIVEDEKEPMLP